MRPHVKEHRLPEVVGLCLGHGMSKFKAATIAEAEMTAAASGHDILLASPLVGSISEDSCGQIPPIAPGCPPRSVANRLRSNEVCSGLIPTAFMAPCERVL